MITLHVEKNDLMKVLCTSVFLFYFVTSAKSQTKILDAAINWNSPSSLTIFLTDTLVSLAEVQIGTTFNGNNVVNDIYTIGSDILCNDNVLVIPLTSVIPGVYYVGVRVTMMDSSVQELQFKSAN